MLKKIVKLGGILCLISFITTLLLAGANYITKDIISTNTEKTHNESRQELVEAEKFEQIAENVYEGISDGDVSGYCVSVTPRGYGGDIDMMVGFSQDLSVTGIKIIESNETAGLGSNASKPEFSQKLRGKKPELSINKNGNASDNEIDAMSGATITSQAVADGINTAYGMVKEAAEK